MNIIDSQVHVWPADRPDRPLDHHGLDRPPFGYEELIAAMDRAGVDRAILVPPSFEADRNDYAIEAVQKHPGRFAIMGRVPLDGGATWRGRRVLGENKTLRGAVVMVAATMLCALVQAMVAAHAAWARPLELVAFARVHPLAWGALLGAGYIAGELPNSFLKRQLGIAPGAGAAGGRGVIFWLVDQLDSLAGVLVFMCAVWVPPLGVVAWLVGITLGVHPVMALVMFALGLKARVG
jgi:hypothetical protein